MLRVTYRIIACRSRLQRNWID